MPITLFDAGVPIDYIHVDTERVPYSFSIKLWDRTYTLTFRYNDAGCFFTVDLYTSAGEALAFGDPVRYGRPLFGSIEDERFPLPVIAPYCLTGDGIDTVTFENFGKTVKLYLFERWAAGG